jgi:hypothetical protein
MVYMRQAEQFIGMLSVEKGSYIWRSLIIYQTGRHTSF